MMIYSGRMKNKLKTAKNITNIKEYLDKQKITMSEFARYYEIPLRTVQNWCYGVRKPSPWLERWILEKIEEYSFHKGTHEMLKKESEYM